MTMGKQHTECCVCGTQTYMLYDVIWPTLRKEWELSDEELAYINRQQGHCCAGCGANMRSRALAKAMLLSFGRSCKFPDFVEGPLLFEKNILEINKAGNLHPYLARHPRHVLVEFPQFDMMQMALPSESFDIIIHSDTLEHVPDPIQGLTECLRLLRPGGKCFFTVPVLVGRATRSRAGLPDSYHGTPGTNSCDYKVHTEFGHDCWRKAFEAGFCSAKIYALEYPSALAFELEKNAA